MPAGDGQIEVGAGTELDYETQATYMVTVMAEDSFGESASIMVTIMVTDVDKEPEIMVGGLAVSGESSIDYAENDTGDVATYTASGPDAAMATWSLGGDDAGDFRISSGGVLTFDPSPDFENPADADTDNVYMVTVVADDGAYMDTHDVTVTVTNVDERGMVTLSHQQPQVGDIITATLTDPDGDTSGVTWQWEISENRMDPWTDLEGATNASYSITEGEIDRYLRATASYTDAEGSDKSAAGDTDASVIPEDHGDSLVNRYDENNSGRIDKNELANAVFDYNINGTLTKADLTDLIFSYEID